MKRPFLPPAFFMLFALWPMYMMHRILDDAGFQSTVFKSPALQAEFHSTAADVYDLYNAEGLSARAALTEEMRLAHVYDNLFLCFYGLFLAFFAIQGFRLTRMWHFLFMVLLAVLAACADLIENGAIVGITRTLDAGESDFSLLLKRLAFFTWLKWLSLAMYFGVLARFFRYAAQWGNLPQWAGIFLRWACLIVCFVTFGAFMTRSARWENWMSQAFVLIFAGVFVFSLFFKRKISAV